MSGVVEVLERAADLIEPEGAWTQGAEARNAKGRPVNWHDPAAVCFCAIGALNRCAGLRPNERPSEAPSWETRRYFAAVAGEMPLPFNDRKGRTQAEVVTALRTAAAKAREAGQ